MTAPYHPRELTFLLQNLAGIRARKPPRSRSPKRYGREARQVGERLYVVPVGLLLS